MLKKHLTWTRYCVYLKKFFQARSEKGCGRVSNLRSNHSNIFWPEMAGGSRSENLVGHTLQEFLGVSSLPNLKGKALGTRLLPAPVSVIHLSYHSDKYEGNS